MITIIYSLLVVMVIALIGWNLFTEKKLTAQINAAMVLIPMVMRALMIK